MKCSSEMLQNLPYYWNTKTNIVCFSFRAILYKKARNERRKKLHGFSYYKIWQILKRFAGTFHQA